MINYSTPILALYTRDLNKLKEELSLYTSESNIWKTSPGISNSAGNLALHLIGNLNHFIGATLGGTDYIRDRDAEFEQRNIPRHTLINDIDSTIGILIDVLGSLTNADLSQEFPLAIRDKKDSTANMLIHLYGHLAYHLGQINYHRRLLDK
jgi:uncharacterized damage-inducible protein DinB